MSGSEILANAHRIAPLIRERAGEVETARRLTTPVREWAGGLWFGQLTPLPVI